MKKKSRAGVNSYEIFLPLEDGGPLDRDRPISCAVQEKVREAIDKIPPGDRSNFLRQAITQAVIDAGLLDD